MALTALALPDNWKQGDGMALPTSKILIADDFIELVFTRGIYGVIPFNATLNFSKMSSL